MLEGDGPVLSGTAGAHTPFSFKVAFVGSLKAVSPAPLGDHTSLEHE